MAGQPAGDTAGSPGRMAGPFTANSASAVTGSPVTDSPVTDSPVTDSPVPDSPATGSPANGISDFGKFDWFVESDGFEDRTAPGRPWRFSRRSGSGTGSGSGSGALLPGDWPQPASTETSTASSEATGTAGYPGRSATAAKPARGLLASARRILAADGKAATGRLPRARRFLVVGALALACTVLGGVIGGYVALRSENTSRTNPDYSLGTVPPALTNRPAGSVAGIAARVMPSVVMIKVAGGQATGSGFIIHGGYIVTDNHVVTLDGQVPNASIQVFFSNGSSAAGTIVGRDPFSDVAIVKVKGAAGLPALSLGNSAGVEVGDPVLAVGSPLGLADTVTSGIVSAVDRPVQPGVATGAAPQVYFDAIQTDAPINPGNSGGPLVNSSGQVIGIDAAIDTLGANPLTGQGGSIGLGFAIPINQARRVTLELIQTGHATHAVIGAEINVGWTGNGAQIAPTQPSGKSTVVPGGPAAKVGLQPGDVIVKFAGQLVNNGSTLLDEIRSQPPGARASVTFIRARQTRTVSMQLGSAGS
jgi:S1-C subfamily serine protease